MLSTRSPVLTSSATASPTGFRSATQKDSPGPSLSGPRRPSSSSLAASASPSWLSCQHLSNAASAESSSASEQLPPASPPPPPRPKPMTSVAAASSVSSETNDSARPQDKASAQHHIRAGSSAHPVSPNKRRASGSDLASAEAGSEAGLAAQDPSQAPVQAVKKARPDEPPTKILPIKYEECDVSDIVELIACMLSELIVTNDTIRVPNGGLTRFHSRTAPGISVRDYLHRLARHATLTPPLLLAMVYYIDRLCALYQDFNINTLTVHRFLITAATVASKGLSDLFWNNATYARVGGVRVAELKLLEVEFLYRLEWRIVPNPEVLVSYYQGLVERTPGYELEAETELSESGDEENIEDDVLAEAA